MMQTHRPRSRRRHRHAEDEIFDSAGFLAIAAEAAEAGERELLTAKANLATQLERLDDALDAAFEVLTPAEFTSLVWRLENPHRTNFLRNLRMPSVKRPTDLAASHGLAQLHKWPAARRLEAARFITTPTFRELAEPLQNWFENQDDDVLTASLTEDPGQANAVRLMVLAHWYDGPDVVAALRAVLTGGLSLPTWPADVVDAIVAACAELEPLWLAAAIGPVYDEHDGAADDSGDHGARALGWGAVSEPDEGIGMQAVEQHAHQQSAYSTAESADITAEGLSTAAGGLRRALAAARISAHQVTDDLDAGRVPPADALKPIAELARTVEHAQDLLTRVHAEAHGLGTCEELAAALETAATALHADSGVRARLARLTLLDGPGSHRAVIDGVHNLARALIEEAPWDDVERRHFDGLSALLDLIDAVAAGDTSTVMELHTKAQQALPDELAPALVIALLGQLTTKKNQVDHAASEADPASVEPVATVTPANAPAVGLPPQRTPAVQTAETDAVPALPEVQPSAGSAPTSPPFDSVTQLNEAAHIDDTAARIDAKQPATAATIEPGAADTRRSSGHSPASIKVTATSAQPTEDVVEVGPDSAVDTPVLHGTLNAPSQNAVASGHRGSEQRQPDSASGEYVAALVHARRYCLAFHAAQALGRDTNAKALRVLTFAEAVRSETGPTAMALRTALDDLHLHHFDADRPAQLTLLAAAVRAALVTADPNAGEVVTSIVSTLNELPHVAALTGAIGIASARGLLFNRTMLVALAPIAGADNDITMAAEAACTERDRPRTLRFQRANQLVDHWWSRSGRIGRALEIAANDRRADVGIAAGTLRELAKREDIQRALLRDDAKLRGPGSRAMEGAASRRLIDHARESLDAIGAWVDAVRANSGNDLAGLRVPAPLTDLRHQVRSEWAAALTELQALATNSDDVFLAASATACWQSLQRSVNLLDGKSLQGAEPVPNEVLNRELLRCPTLPFDSTLTPIRAVTLADIEAAASTTWTDAFSARLASEDYAAARVIVDAVSEQDPDNVGGMLDQLEQNTARSRAELRGLRTEVAAQVEKAARLGRLDQAAYTEVLAQLEAARPDRDDLGAVRRQLEDLRSHLPKYAQAAKDALWDRVTAELNKAASKSADSGIKVADNAAEFIKGRIDAGDLATAEEYLLSALVGEEPPSVKPSGHLEAFMAVPDALPGGITPALVRAARNGGTSAGLDFSRLSSTDRAAAADGLDVWMDLRDDRQLRNQRSRYYTLAPALRLAGIEFTGDRPPHGLSGSPNRRWVDLTGVKRVGDPLVPAFGSLTGKLLRVLLCWGAQDARTLLTWVAQDQSDIPVVVALFGTMSMEQRRALAKACAEHQDKPIIVLDDAALAYLAAYGHGRFATTERILLPFAATNPYHPNATGKVPSEMFYGRRDERNRLLDPFGTSLLYGGRQLGKSALLQAAARHFELTADRVAVYLSLPGGFGATRTADDLWDMIADLLAEREITVPRRRSRDAVKHVEVAITTWLGQNANRRLVLLLDECDGFFDADAKTNFTHTSRLRDLMNATDRRFKPVFAGLHQVQRFAHLPNQPLAHAHFGDPIAIGPLSPDPAYGLMFTPMEALGISFASDELIHRVLAYCNYQPKLLQLVGEALVRESFNRRGADQPPYIIRDEELERVIGSDTVRQKVRETVQLTLNLDSRYKLIALVVALDALENGADHTIGTTHLREQCLEWWPDGFTGQGADEFRSLLEEMRGLGVLADTGGRWRLRSSNVLRLLGSAEAIADELCGEEWRKTPTMLSAEHARRCLTDGTASAMTEKQLATVIERRNQLRIVLGTPATGIDRVPTLLAEEANRTGAKFALHQATSPSSYRKELRGGEPIDGHRVVLCDLSQTKRDKALSALRQADEILPAAGVTRAVVALVDATSSSIFDGLGGPDLDDIADRLVPLRRLTHDGIRSWAAELTESHQISCFSDPTSQRLLMDVTGGWPVLLDEALKLAAGGRSAPRVCEVIAERLGTIDAAEALIQAVGLAGVSQLAAAFQQLISYDDPMTGDDIVELFEVSDCGGGRSARLLRYLDVIVERLEDGMWGPEPVLAAAWKVART